MSMSLLPGLLGLTAGRTFSLYPPILGIAHNEWRFPPRASRSGICGCQHPLGGRSLHSAQLCRRRFRQCPDDHRWFETRNGMARRHCRAIPQAGRRIAPDPRCEFARSSAREANLKSVLHPAPVISIRLESPALPVKTGRKAVVVVMLGVVGISRHRRRGAPCLPDGFPARPNQRHARQPHLAAVAVGR